MTLWVHSAHWLISVLWHQHEVVATFIGAESDVGRLRNLFKVTQLTVKASLTIIFNCGAAVDIPEARKVYYSKV